jgi:hypothetical protein
MSYFKPTKTIYLSNNNEDIKEKLKNLGFSLCICTEFENNPWLYFNGMSADIHGAGVGHNAGFNLLPLKILKEEIISVAKQGEKVIICNSVDDFVKEINIYKNEINPNNRCDSELLTGGGC